MTAPSRTRKAAGRKPTKAQLREAWMHLAKTLAREATYDFLCFLIDDGPFAESVKSELKAQVQGDLCEHWTVASGAAICVRCGGVYADEILFTDQEMRVLYCLLQAEMCR